MPFKISNNVLKCLVFLNHGQKPKSTQFTVTNGKKKYEFITHEKLEPATVGIFYDQNN